jgi:hypothetical protein
MLEIAVNDLIKIKSKWYQVWDKGENNIIVRSQCEQHYMLTIHRTYLEHHNLPIVKQGVQNGSR